MNSIIRIVANTHTHTHTIEQLGYIPSSKLLARDTEHESPEPSTEEESIGQRKASSASALVCQRCYALKHYNKVLPVHVAPDDFKRHLALLKKKKALVVHVVDLFDFPGSVYPALVCVCVCDGLVRALYVRLL